MNLHSTEEMKLYREISDHCDRNAKVCLNNYKKWNAAVSVAGIDINEMSVVSGEMALVALKKKIFNDPFLCKDFVK